MSKKYVVHRFPTKPRQDFGLRLDGVWKPDWDSNLALL